MAFNFFKRKKYVELSGESVSKKTKSSKPFNLKSSSFGGSSYIRLQEEGDASKSFFSKFFDWCKSKIKKDPVKRSLLSSIDEIDEKPSTVIRGVGPSYFERKEEKYLCDFEFDDLVKQRYLDNEMFKKPEPQGQVSTVNLLDLDLL